MELRGPEKCNESAMDVPLRSTAASGASERLNRRTPDGKDLSMTSMQSACLALLGVGLLLAQLPTHAASGSCADRHRSVAPRINTIHAPDGDVFPCRIGFVFRNARPGDHVCVAPASRARVARENERAESRRDPNGARGLDSCRSGFVWREAVPGDTVCVTPARRAEVGEENRLAPTRVVNF